MRTAPWALLVLAAGCRAPGPAGGDGGAFGPAAEVGRLYDLAYRGEVSLDLADPGRSWLLTRVELALTPRAGPVGRLDLGPALYDQGLRPDAAPDAWEWALSSLESDRPARVQATPWTLSVVADAPPGPGETWRVALEYALPVGRLEQGLHASDLLPEPDTADGALRTVLEMGEKVLARFTKDAPTSSFAEDDLHVLIPPWPLVYDCGGRPADEVFPPLECVSRHQLPVEVRVRVPPGWQAILPTPPRWEDGPGGERVAVVERLPVLLLLAPRLALREIAVAGRRVTLCAPAARAADLDELGRLVARALPALEARLGPYPQADPVVCLAPTPLDLWGLARGRLALVDVETFSALGLRGPEANAGLGASLAGRLEAWIAGDPYFRELRQELVLHELTHHWWRTELPDRWERLLGEGAATLIAREVQLAEESDERLRYFAGASPWLDGAGIELAAASLPSRAAYLRRGPVPAGPGEVLLPYLHGLLLLEGLFLDEAGRPRWPELRAMHEASPAFSRAPAAVIADPAGRERLARLLAEDAPLRPLSRVDPVDHALRCTAGMLAALEDDPALGPVLRPLRLALPSLVPGMRAEMIARLRSAYGVPDEGWTRAGAVLDAAGVARCADPPAAGGPQDACLLELGGTGLGHLAGLMGLADPGVRRALDELPEGRELLFRPRRPRELRAAAEAVLARPVEVRDGDAARIGGDRTLGEARVTLLRDRLAARWAAEATLELLPLARFPGAGEAAGTPGSEPAR